MRSHMTLSGKKRDPEKQPNSFELAILKGLQDKPVFQGKKQKGGTARFSRRKLTSTGQTPAVKVQHKDPRRNVDGARKSGRGR